MQVSSVQQLSFLRRKAIVQLAVEQWNTDRAYILNLLKLPLWGRLASNVGRRPASGIRQASLQQTDKLSSE